MVEEPIARHVVVDPDDVRRAGVADERLELRRRHTRPAREPPEERVLPIDAPGEKVEREEPPVVFEPRLVREPRGREDGCDVLGLHEPSSRTHTSDGAHRSADGPALDQDRSREGCVAARAGVPETVERREAGRGERLVDGSEVDHPRVALGHAPGKLGEPVRKPVLEKARMRRTATVMHEPDDWAHAQAVQALEPLVAPVEARALFPEYRLAESANAQRGESVEVVCAPGVACPLQLVDVFFAPESHQAALGSRPELDLAHAGTGSKMRARGAPPPS